MRKIWVLSDSCDDWKAGRDIKGKPLTFKECWACFYNLFGYCWLEEYQKMDALVVLALEGNQEAKETLHSKLERGEFEK